MSSGDINNSSKGKNNYVNTANNAFNSNYNNDIHYRNNIYLFNQKDQETSNNDYKNIDIFLNIKDS